MRLLAVLAAVLGCMIVVQCDDNALLRELSQLDFKKVIDGIFTTNLNNLDVVLRDRVTSDDGTLRNRKYDWATCMNELGNIADGLNRTEMWAMQGEYVDSV